MLVRDFHLHKTHQSNYTLTCSWNVLENHETESIKVKNIIKSLKSSCNIAQKNIILFRLTSFHCSSFRWTFLIVWWMPFSLFCDTENAKNVITALEYCCEHWTSNWLLFWRIQFFRESAYCFLQRHTVNYIQRQIITFGEISTTLIWYGTNFRFD